MRPFAGGLEIPANGSVTLAPGGSHIMFERPKEPLKEGGKLPVTLTFEKAGTVDTVFDILAIGANGPAMDHGSMKMDMGQ
jgi:hypothetical protein